MAFFNLFDDVPIVRGDEEINPPKNTVRRKDHTCAECGAFATCQSPKLEPRGNGEKRVLIVTDSPSKTEDEAGFFGHSKSLVFLKHALKDMGFNLFKDCWVTSSRICYAEKHHGISIDACRKNLLATIEQLQPKAVILLGDNAFNSLIRPKLTGRINGTEAAAFYGEIIPDQEFGYYVCPTYHPDYLLETRRYEGGNISAPLHEREPCMYDVWKLHLQSAMKATERPFYESNYLGDCLTTTDEVQALEWIAAAMRWKYLSFDYETTGIKPYRKEQEIVCVSISDGFLSYAFPFFQSDEFQEAFKKLMRSNSKKIAHNAQFEYLWTAQKCTVWVENWYWDTMLGQHCIANKKPTGLKFCVYAELGIVGYDDSVDRYIKSSEEEQLKYGDNALNHIKDAPLNDLLTYCAMDSLLTYRLFQSQERNLVGILRTGFDFLMECMQTLAKATFHGIRIDAPLLNATEIKLTEDMDVLHTKIMNDVQVKQWDTSTPFNYNSSTQLSKLLFGILKVAPEAYTDTGKPSVDKENLPLYADKVPFIKDLLEYRKLSKIRDSFVTSYKRETTGEYLHAFTNLNRVETFRTGMQSVNLQQVPKRDKVAKTLLRSFIMPDKGHKLVEIDYSTAEVIVAACYSQDPNLIKYVTTPGADMHKELAADIFLLNIEEVSKELRQATKGHGTFSMMYGSYYKQTAPDLWNDAELFGLKDHLRKKGIKTFHKFEAQVQEAERIFWEERFPVHYAWRKQSIEDYKKKGYVELLTGFRCYGPIQRNAIFNYPVQGASAHLLLWGLNKVQNRIEKQGMESRLLCQIHDAAVFSVYPPEEALIDYWMWLYCTQKIHEQFPWMNVPIKMEKEAGEIDQSWSTLKTIGVLKGE